MGRCASCGHPKGGRKPRHRASTENRAPRPAQVCVSVLVRTPLSNGVGEGQVWPHLGETSPSGSADDRLSCDWRSSAGGAALPHSVLVAPGFFPPRVLPSLRHHVCPLRPGPHSTRRGGGEREGLSLTEDSQRPLRPLLVIVLPSPLLACRHSVRGKGLAATPLQGSPGQLPPDPLLSFALGTRIHS